MSNSFNQCPTHFSRGGKKTSWGNMPPLRLPWLRACSQTMKNQKTSVMSFFSNLSAPIQGQARLNPNFKEKF